MRTTRRARRAISAVVAAVVLVTSGILTTNAAYAAPAALPSKMAAIGDSLSQAIMTCSSLSSCSPNSWTTGTNTTVNSHASRLRALGAQLTTYNFAVTSAKSATLPAQATRLTSDVTYVTMQVGANDACTSTVAGMTPTATFDANVRKALTELTARSPKADIFVASVPNLKRLWEVNRTSTSARWTWAILGLCRSMLANPSSTSAVDMARRDAVQARVNEYNVVLAAACAATPKCWWDGGAVADYVFTRADISTRDYFHPSVTGQATLANVTWAASQWTH